MLRTASGRPPGTSGPPSITGSQLHIDGRVQIELRVPSTWEPVTQSCNAGVGTNRCHEGDRESWRA